MVKEQCYSTFRERWLTKMPRLKWKERDHELEVEGDESFIEKHLTSFREKLENATTSGADDLPQSSREASAGQSSARGLAPAEYLRKVRPKGGTETLTALAKYLADNRNKTQFSRADMNEITREARLKDISGGFYTRAIEQGFIMRAGSENLSITMTGEDAVNRWVSERGNSE